MKNKDIELMMQKVSILSESAFNLPKDDLVFLLEVFASLPDETEYQQKLKGSLCGAFSAMCQFKGGNLSLFETLENITNENDKSRPR